MLDYAGQACCQLWLKAAPANQGSRNAFYSDEGACTCRNLLSEEQHQTLDDLAPQAWQGHQIDYSCWPPSVSAHQCSTEGSGDGLTEQHMPAVCSGLVVLNVRQENVTASRVTRKSKQGGKSRVAKRL